VQWWRALNSPRGMFWSRVATAVILTAAAGIAIAAGDTVWAGFALLLAVVTAAMAVGQWRALRETRREAGEAG
jgi:hypothetical protein